MTEFMCTDVIRGAHNKVEAYILTDSMGNDHEFSKAELKKEIKDGMVNVANIKMTSEGKLKVLK